MSEDAGSEATPRDPSPEEPPDDRARSFRQVRAEEVRAIRRARRLRFETEASPGEPDGDAGDPGEEPDLSALAFSGGGIRSAIFNLGLAQGLARRGLLRRFDYLSINSGGSYIGGWLLAWIRREGIHEVERQLREGACRDPRDADAGAESAGAEDAGAESAGAEGAGDPGREGSVRHAAEPEPVSFLRRFSNYLTPRVGAFSADTWTMVTTYLRNLLVNLLVLVLALAALLVLPRILVLISSWFYRLDPRLPLGLGLGALTGAIVMLGLNQLEVLAPRRGAAPGYARQAGVQLSVLLPLFIAAWLTGLWMWLARVAEDFFLRDWLASRWSWYAGSSLHQEQFEPAAWAVLAALLYFAVWAFGSALFLLWTWIGRRRRSRASLPVTWKLCRAVLLSAPAAGAVGGVLLWAVATLGLGLEAEMDALGYGGHSPWHLLHVTVWKAPAIVGVFLLTAFLQTGLMGRAFPEALRQWWSRLGAWMLIWAITWLGVFGISLYGPILLVLIGVFVCSLLGGGWLLSTAGGVLVGRRTGDRESRPSPWRRLVISIAPQVFIVGLLAVLALAVHAALDPPEELLPPECRDRFWIETPGPAGGGEGDALGAAVDRQVDAETARVRSIVRCHTERLYLGTTRRYSVVSAPGTQAADDGNPATVPAVFLVLGALALALSWRVDINQFSMHLFYRNRLIRAFLGASHRDRRAQPFTGFDPGDDLPLARLSALDEDDPYDGPYPIVDIALNLVAGEELAWQERKAASFVFTPLFSGFEVQGDGDGDPDLQAEGFRPTRGYDQTEEGITLGTTMAISGAAASPSMGSGTTPAMAFLLTVFNVRLGWWLGNTRHDQTWRRMGPPVGLLALFAELFGATDDRSSYVYLSDGGHFDNLGLYELIRRRCRFILVSDAGADPDSSFDDLGNAVRKACTDFGVEIDLDTEAVRKDPDTGLSRRHWTTGTIRYDKLEEGLPPGILVYVKATLTGDEPVDVRAYAGKSAQFPHEATSDQWFSESQFESYRKLGEHIAMEVGERLAGDGPAFEVEEPSPRERSPADRGEK